MFGRFSVWEIVVVVILIIIIFGGRKLPELGRSLGRGITNFRNALKNPKEGTEAEEDAKDRKAQDDTDGKGA
ncbi:MAG: twin-arginine translocase TatA/TatE family subunit [Deltaproteobacteria bacterium]|jgi:sec-independent protein translocase protein TatA|nr:twin-arginine translocase TatA/TatE family subunit [Deltaproteobacteria bacterium]